MKKKGLVKDPKDFNNKSEKKRSDNLLLSLLLFFVFAAAISAAMFSGDGLKTNAASAQNTPPENSKEQISPEALKQIEALVQEKKSRTAAQNKIDSRLLYRIKMERREALAPGVAALENDLVVDEKGYIEVDITAEVSEKLLGALKKIKAEIVTALPQYRSIRARIPIAEIENFAARRDVVFIQPKQEATTSQPKKKLIENPPVNLLERKFTTDFLQPRPALSFEKRAENVHRFLSDQLAGTVTSQADTTHRAALARTLAGVNGSGIKIGVLSDGVNSLAARQGSGDLSSVTVLPGQAGSGDEGTAMLELVYDLAPGAQLYFARATGGIATFAQNIRDLRAAGCDIIIDDVSYFVETPFQNGQAAGVVSPTNAGVVVEAVNDVTVGSLAGALYFSSAGNSGNKNDNTASAWEGDFVNGGTAGGILAGAGTLHSFGALTYNTLNANARVFLKWSDPLGASANDYDIFALNSAGTSVVAAATGTQNGNDDPSEDLGNRLAGQRLVIVKFSGADRFLHLNANGGSLSTSTSGVIYGHNGGLNSISVAATPAGPAIFSVLALGPFPNAHSAANVVETFSSDGPRRIFYNADSTPITPGNFSSSGGQLLQKPDITAADGASTTTPGFLTFFGTSAAAPHAGAIAALLKSASPLSTNTQIYNALIIGAIDIETAGTDRDSGAGIVMPIQAMAALGVTGPAFVENGTVTSGVVTGNGNGNIDPGETVNLTIPLNNFGLSNATSVSATLSTSTAGVTVLSSATRTYPDLPAAVGSAASATPYSFSLAGNFPCGGIIDFTLTVNFTGGSSPQVFNFSLDTGTPLNVSTTLDTIAPAPGAGYIAVTGTQTGRLVRNGVASSCSAAKAAPGLNDSTAGRRFDTFTFTASASGCTTVTLTSGGNLLFVAAYNASGYVPTNPNANYVADPGSSSSASSFSFNAVAGQSYTIVVHEVTVGGGSGVNYTLNVAGPIAGLCGAVPTAAGVRIGGRVSSNSGIALSNALVSLVNANGEARSARTNPFGYYFFENVPAGETYIFRVKGKRFEFVPQIVFVSGETENLNFAAQP